MKAYHSIVFILLIIGGLNWLLVGLFNWDIGMIFGGQEAIVSKIIYILVGVSAISLAITHRNECRYCVAKEESPISTQGRVA